MAKDGRRNDGCRDAVQQVCISAVEQRRHVKSHVARVVFGQYLTRDQRELLLLSSARRTLASSSETLSISANTERLHGQVGPFCFGWAGRRRSVPPLLLLPPPLFHTLKVYGFRLFASFFSSSFLPSARQRFRSGEYAHTLHQDQVAVTPFAPHLIANNLRHYKKRQQQCVLFYCSTTFVYIKVVPAAIESNSSISYYTQQRLMRSRVTIRAEEWKVAREPQGEAEHIFSTPLHLFLLYFFFLDQMKKKSVQAPPSSAAATIFRVGNSFHAAVQVRNRRGSNTTKRKNHRAVYYFLFFSLLLENNRTRVLQEGRKAFSGYIHFFF